MVSINGLLTWQNLLFNTLHILILCQVWTYVSSETGDGVKKTLQTQELDKKYTTVTQSETPLHLTMNKSMHYM